VARSRSSVVSLCRTAKAAPVKDSNGESEFEGFVSRAEPRLQVESQRVVYEHKVN
jgi:hypothetical protein